MATAWVVINIIASLIRNQFVNRIVAISAWTIAALSILRLLDPVTQRSRFACAQRRRPANHAAAADEDDRAAAGDVLACQCHRQFPRPAVRSFTDLTPSIQVLLGKLIRIALLFIAVVIVLSSVGIDLSVLAVFSGAVGVGIGFGLQKIVSNLVSGIILLADKSIKPGDIIAVGEQFGTVRNMGARYTAVDTRDGRTYLVPNDDFVTQRVVNWTYSDETMRLEIKFGRPTRILRGCRKSPPCGPRSACHGWMKKPEPVCHIVTYGDKIEYMLWFWIKDPSAGVSSVRSEVLLALWDAIDRGGLAIPRPGYEAPSERPVEESPPLDTVEPAQPR